MWHDRTIDLAAMVYYPRSLFHSCEENNGAAGRTFNSITLISPLNSEETWDFTQFFWQSMSAIPVFLL